MQLPRALYSKAAQRVSGAQSGLRLDRIIIPGSPSNHSQWFYGVKPTRLYESRPYGRRVNGIAHLRLAIPQKSRLHRRLSRGRSGEICSCRAPCIVRPRSVLAELLRSVTTQSLSSHSTLRKPPMRAAFSWSEWRDLNSRPYGPEPYALPNCATPR